MKHISYVGNFQKFGTFLAWCYNSVAYRITVHYFQKSMAATMRIKEMIIPQYVRSLNRP